MKKIILSILTLVLITIGVKAQIPTAGLVGQYEFSSGALTDNINSVSFTKTGTASTTITDRFGNTNEAISLNGDDLLRPDIDFNLTSSNPFLARTVSFWVKTATNDGNVRLIYNDNDRTSVGDVDYKGLIVYLQNGQIKASNRVGTNGNLVTHSVSVSDNVWHHISIQGYSTSISGTVRFYTYIFVDGVKQGGNGYQAPSGTVPVTTNEHIGNLGFSRLKATSLSNTQKYLDGLDEVLFYTRVLTDPEVNSITNFAPCTVNIPDANFKAYLVGNAAINTNGDTEIQCGEASAFTGIINCNNLSISDLTGIEAFTSITYLTFTNNAISSIDLSQNTALTHFYCENNLLTSLDLSLNTSLKTLYCQNNQLSSLSLTNNTQLSNLRCSENSLTNLNVSANPDLQYLFCNDNQISSLDVSQNTLLKELIVSDNNLTSLDITANTALEELQIDQNQISTIDLSQNVLLERVFCRNTALTSLDCSNNSSLYWIVVNDNNLQSLDVSNGNNTNVGFFWAHNNPNLNCITVDDDTYSTTNWTGSSFKFETTTSFSTNCVPPCTINIPDANLKAILVANTFINTNGNSEIECSEASAYTGDIGCQNASISDMTGIEAFSALTELYCDNNPFTSIDLSQNTALEFLSVNNHALSSLDVTQNTALTFLDCGYGTLTSIDLSQNTSLTRLYINNNSINSVNLSNLPLLEQLECGHNALTSIDLSQNTSLFKLFCFNNPLNGLDVSQNTALLQLRCRNNQISTLDLSQNTLLTELSCQNNAFTTTIDLSQNSALQYLTCYNNGFTSLDLSQNTSLTQLDCKNNLLTSLNMANGNNTNVNYFYTTSNANLNCIQVDDATYSTANWTNVDAHTSFSNNCVVLVNSIVVEGQGNVSTITTNGGTLQMQATVLPANADDATYTWSVTNGTGSATISATGLLTATTNGTVEVTATANDASGITGTKTITISNQSVGINDIAFEGLNIFPNPTNGILNLEIEEALTSIKILDLTGKTIKEFNSEDRQLDLSELTSGIYFLEIANAEKKSVVKIVKR